MKVNTDKFGTMEALQDDFYHFPKGLFHLPPYLKNFLLIEDPHSDIFLWLQSKEESGVALPLLEPELFERALAVELSKEQKQLLQIKDKEEKLQVFCLINFSKDHKRPTANLRHPLALNAKKHIGLQVETSDKSLSFSEPISKDFETRLSFEQRQQMKDFFKSF